MLKLEEEPLLQSAKEALGLPSQEIWEPGHGVHLLVVIHILLVKPDLLPRQLEQAITIWWSWMIL